MDSEERHQLVYFRGGVCPRGCSKTQYTPKIQNKVRREYYTTPQGTLRDKLYTSRSLSCVPREDSLSLQEGQPKETYTRPRVSSSALRMPGSVVPALLFPTSGSGAGGQMLILEILSQETKQWQDGAGGDGGGGALL